MTKEPIAVVGAGGHAKVVVATLLASGFEVKWILDDDVSKHGVKVLGVPVSGPVAALADIACAGAVLAIGDNRARQRLARELKAPWVSVVHSAAWVDPTVKVGAGAVIFAGAVVQAEAIIGAHAIVNTGATVDHDCVIGDFVHLAPGASLAGAVTVGEGGFLATGSVAVPLAKIGPWATVGAGAVVLGEVAAGETVVGVPARRLERKT
jgi:sugar O-acyltransferase (sialic acid O-acetyltransferase NeuD family)